MNCPRCGQKAEESGWSEDCGGEYIDETTKKNMVILEFTCSNCKAKADKGYTPFLVRYVQLGGAEMTDWDQFAAKEDCTNCGATHDAGAIKWEELDKPHKFSFDCAVCGHRFTKEYPETLPIPEESPRTG